MQGWSDLAVLVTDRHVNLKFLERLQISSYIHLRFSEGLIYYYVVEKKICRIILPLHRD